MYMFGSSLHVLIEFADSMMNGVLASRGQVVNHIFTPVDPVLYNTC